MPALPTASYEQRTRVSGASLGVGPSGDAGAGFELVGNALSEYEQRRGSADAAKAIGGLRERFAARKAALLSSPEALKPDLDKKLTKLFDEELTNARDELRSGGIFTRSFAQHFLSEQGSQMRTEAGLQAVSISTAIKNAKGEQDFVYGMQRAARAVEQDPSSFERTFAEQHFLLDQSPMDPARRIQLQDQMADGLLQARELGNARNDPMATLERFKRGDDPHLNGLSVEAADKVSGAAKRQLIENTVGATMQAYQQAGVGIGNETVVETEKLLPPELVDDYRAALRSDLSTYQNQQHDQHAEQIAAIERSIDAGTAGLAEQQEIRTLHQRSALSTAEYSSMLQRFDAAKRKREEEYGSLERVRQALALGVPLDPQRDGKALDAAFTASVGNELPGSPRFQSTALAWASRVRMLPGQAQSYLRSAARSPDQGVALAAADFYQRLELQSPEAAGSLDQDSTLFLANLGDMVRAGAAPGVAFETARKNVYEASPPVIQQRRNDLTQLHSKDSGNALTAFIDRDLDTVFKRQPEATQRLSSDFNRLTDEFYLKTGDINLARERAWANVKRVYGETNVNGRPELQAFPIERYGFTPKEVRDAVGKLVTESNLTTADGAPVNPADVAVVADGITQRLIGNALTGELVRPSYSLITAQGDVILDDQGRRARLSLPSAEDLQERIRKAEAAQKAKDAADVEANRKARGERLIREGRQRQIAAEALL